MMRKGGVNLRGSGEGMAHQSAFVGPDLASVGPESASVGPESVSVGPESASLGPCRSL